MAIITRYPTAYTDTTGFNGVFVDPTNAYADDTAWATKQSSKNLEYATSWRGFDFSAIPDGSTINSVTVRLAEKVGADVGGDWSMSLWADVTSAGALAPGVLTAIGADDEYTQAATHTTEFDYEPALNTDPTLTQLKGANFGVRIELASGNSKTLSTYSINYISVTVDYTASTTTYTRDHTVDAIVQLTDTKAHTVDAIAQLTDTKSHTVDAAMLIVDTVDHTTDAIVQLTDTVDHTVDAILLDTYTRDHTIDANILTVATVEHTVDANVYLIGTEDHTTDAVLLATDTVDHTVDAHIVSQPTVEHTIDAVLQL